MKKIQVIQWLTIENKYQAIPFINREPGELISRVLLRRIFRSSFRNMNADQIFREMECDIPTFNSSCCMDRDTQQY
jgi:hypothetical protein